MAVKKWVLPHENHKFATLFCEKYGITPLAASVLTARGYDTLEQAERFLTPPSEFAPPLSLLGMEKAVQRILLAVEKGEEIAIYGDYDCDGITATAELYSYLLYIGGNARYYIPERQGDGYGINVPALLKLHGEGVSLVITVDNGISAINEALFAKELGLSLIITDHHQPGDLLPVSVATVNPHQVGDTSGLSCLSGAGVAFKLVCALEEARSGKAITPADLAAGISPILRSCLELAAVGTIGDIVPLIDENRLLVLHGLASLRDISSIAADNNIGLRELVGIAGASLPDLTAQTIAFSIVPRINAAGRMGNAGMGLKLLLCNDVKQAVDLSRTLDETNRQRQDAELLITSSIEDLLRTTQSLLSSSVLILAGESWNHGVLGIVASRMVERYGKPAFVMTLEDGVYKGSARSLGDFHLFEALSYCKEHLERFGGHQLAAGFSISPDKLPAFRLAMEDYSNTVCTQMPTQALLIDKRLTPHELTTQQIDGLACLEPYGAQNPSPLFLIEEAEVTDIARLSGGRHLRLTLKVEQTVVTALWFGMSEQRLCCRIGDRVNAVGSLTVNEYQSKRSVTFKIDDLRPTSFVQETFFEESRLFEKLKAYSLANSDKTTSKEILSLPQKLPTREELLTVYKLLRAIGPFTRDAYSLYLKALEVMPSFFKLQVALTALREVGLILPDSGEGIILRKLEPFEKVNIFDAPILNI